MQEELSRSELYDIIYGIAQEEFGELNPCDYVDGKCREDRRQNSKGRCCEGCKYLKKTCSVKSLGCKLWLCHSLSDNNLYLRGFVKALYIMASKCGLKNQAAHRRSKEEVL